MTCDTVIISNLKLNLPWNLSKSWPRSVGSVGAMGPIGPAGLTRLLGALLLALGLLSLLLAPLLGNALFPQLWRIEPFTYIGAALLILGLAATTASYLVAEARRRHNLDEDEERRIAERWTQVTQQYFELFNHDLGRPLRRILGKEREIRESLQSPQSNDTDIRALVRELLDEIEEQTPSFRLMMSNIQVLIELETPNTGKTLHAVEPAEVVRRIVDRYSLVAADSRKQITWWSEPTDFGIVHCDSSAIEHIVTNLVDNTVRYAQGLVEIGLTRHDNDAAGAGGHFCIRVWDDGPGIAARYLPYLFDRGWTPEVARREERTSSGLGLFIAYTLAKRYGGDLTVSSITDPAPDHHTAFTVTLPLSDPAARPPEGTS